MHAPRLLRGVLSSRQRGVKLHPVIGIVLVVITYALFHYCAEINWQRAAIHAKGSVSLKADTNGSACFRFTSFTGIFA